MTKVTFKILTFTLLCILGLSSCDNKGYTISSTGAFAVIATDTDGVHARTNIANGKLVSPEISKLTPGQCYVIDYKVTEYPMDGYLYTASTFNLVQEQPIPQSEIDYLDVQDRGVPVVSFNLQSYSHSTHWLDRWFFYVSKTDEEQNLKAKFYYNAANQIDKEGNDVTGKNIMILDVVFTEQPLGELSSTEQTGGKANDVSNGNSDAFLTVGNLSRMRYNFPVNSEDLKQDNMGDSYASVLVLFRYLKAQSTGEPVVQYLGASRESEPNALYMVIYQE